MRLLLLLVFCCATFYAFAQPGAERRAAYRPSLGFLQFAGDSCFDITRREADLAAKGRYWNEAIAYYRAARSCPDANQERRQIMYQKVQACRDSAEEELIRRERLAIAANRADDAEDMLHTFDRSLAYRLADFTNQYIVPPGEESGDVLQALYDTWYETSGQATLPFCYQLQDNAGVTGLYDTYIGFFDRGRDLKIFAFSPKKHQLYTWKASTMQPGPTYPIDTTMNQCTVSPDGRTLLFKGSEACLLWRKPAETYRLPLKPMPRNMCFNQAGDVFYYLNESEEKLYELRLTGLNKKEQYSRKRSEPMVFAQDVPPQKLIDIAVRGNQIWLAYPDNITLLERNPTDKSTHIVRTIHFKPILPDYAALEGHLYPESNKAIYFDGVQVFHLPIPATSDTLRYTPSTEALLATTADGLMTATAPDGEWIPLMFEGQMIRGIVFNEGPVHLALKTSGDSLRYQITLQSLEGYQILAGAFDAEKRYFISATNTGNLLVWELFGQPGTTRTPPRSETTSALLSTNGQFIVTTDAGNLQVLDAETAQKNTFNYTAPAQKTISPCAASAHWVAWQEGVDTVAIHSLGGAHQWFVKIDFPEFQHAQCAFSADEKWVAVTTQSNQVVILNLATGAVRTRTTDGAIQQIDFLPKTAELAILETTGLDGNDCSVRFWDYQHDQPKARMSGIALHDYPAIKMALSPEGQHVALSKGDDVTIYNLDNLQEEDAHIRPFGVGKNQGRVVSLLFSPADEDALVVGYVMYAAQVNTVVVWDVSTEQPRYRFTETGSEQGYLTALSFTPDEQGLRSLYSNGTVLTRMLDVRKIQNLVQSDFRRLIAFSPDQIRAYSLDRALRYTGNFQKLIQSHDFPLIRSFFSYYREEALNSNNIERVADYCNRANSLYVQLDPITQEALRPTILEMYEDYNWEYLQRNRPDDALRVVNEMRRNFGSAPEALRAEATTSLLRNDLAGTARQYTEWAIQTVEKDGDDAVFEIQLRKLSAKITQLQQFGRLSANQTNCLCNLFGDFTAFDNICPQGRTAGQKKPVSDADLRWDIFKRIYHAGEMEQIDPQIAELELALQEVRTVSQRNKTGARPLLEKTILKLADAYATKGIVADYTPTTLLFLQKAIDLLGANAPFTPQREEMRVPKRISCYTEMGNVLLETDKLAEATKQYETALQEIEQYVKALPTENAESRAERFKSDYASTLWQQLGVTRLYSGDAAGAQTAFTQANDLSYYGLDSRFPAHVLLLNGNNREALDGYKIANTSVTVAQIIVEIERLTNVSPTRRTEFEALIGALQTSALQAYPESVDSNEIGYYIAAFHNHRARALADWPAALRESSEQLRQAAILKLRFNTSEDWRNNWVNAILFKAYYLIINAKGDLKMLDTAIKISEEGEAVALAEQPYLLTNHAHALLLRGDRAGAIAVYKQFLNLPSTVGEDNWDVLQKDFKDLAERNVVWPDLPGIIAAIRPK